MRVSVCARARAHTHLLHMLISEFLVILEYRFYNILNLREKKKYRFFHPGSLRVYRSSVIILRFVCTLSTVTRIGFFFFHP